MGGQAAAWPPLTALAWAGADHAFRHAYGTLVSRLARRFGVHRVEAAEDAVQAAMMAALRTWPKGGTPDEPVAWLYRVALNHLIDELRRSAQGDVSLDDDELRMLFVCADDRIPLESQLVLALKVLCGFSTHEIALRLLTSEHNVQKRLSRARAAAPARHIGRHATAANAARAARCRAADGLPAVQRGLQLGHAGSPDPARAVPGSNAAGPPDRRTPGLQQRRGRRADGPGVAACGALRHLRGRPRRAAAAGGPGPQPVGCGADP